jgi:hypothetical protein
MDVAVPAGDPWLGLDAFIPLLGGFRERLLSHEQRTKEALFELRVFKEADSEREMALAAREKALSDVAAGLNIQLRDSEQRCKSLTDRLMEAERTVQTQERIITELRITGDKTMLRNGLTEMSDSFLCYLGQPTENCNSSDDAMVARAKDLCGQCLTKPCEACAEQRRHMGDLERRLGSLIHSDETGIDLLFSQLETRFSEMERQIALLTKRVEDVRETIGNWIGPLMTREQLTEIELLDAVAFLKSQINKRNQAHEALVHCLRGREDRYIRMLMQLSHKLSDLLEEEHIEVDFMQDAVGQRAQLVDKLGTQLKCMRDHLQEFADILIGRDEAMEHLNGLITETAAKMAEIFQCRLPAGELLPGIITMVSEASQKFQSEIAGMTKAAEDQDSEKLAIEHRVRGLFGRTDSGSIFEILDALQDQMETLEQQNKGLKESRAILRDCVLDFDPDLKKSDSPALELSDSALVARVLARFGIEGVIRRA